MLARHRLPLLPRPRHSASFLPLRTMSYPSHLRSSPPSARPSASPSPSSSSLSFSRYSSSITSGLSKGLASLAGTASAVAGNVGALTGATGREEVVGDDPESKSGGKTREGRYGVRAAVGGWLGSKGIRRGTFTTQDRLLLFPGWAVKRITEDGGQDDALENGAQVLDPDRPDPHIITPFEIHLHVSGFATTARPPEYASLYSRAFSRLAYSIASLPALPTPASSSSSSSQAHSRDATISNRTLSSSPQEIQGQKKAGFFEAEKDEDAGALRRDDSVASSLNSLESLSSVEPLSESPSSSTTVFPSDPTPPTITTTSPSSLPNHRSPSRSGSLPPVLDKSFSSPPASTTSSPGQTSAAATLKSMQTDLLQLHLNLQQRLQPFFASVIPNRRILLEVRPRLRNSPSPTSERNTTPLPPLLSITLTTNLNGSFTETLKIPWDTIVESPECLQMIFPEKLKNEEGHHIAGEAEWVLEVTAKLLSQDGEGVVMEQSGYPQPKTSTPLTGGDASDLTSTAESTPKPRPAVPLTATTLTPLSSATGVRVISDLDDTVKRTDLMAGLREVFRNVFCRSVGELEVKGMGDLYRSLVGDGSGGVKGWHYVSNSPYELFDPIHSFLTTHEFPPGFSLRLKFYGGKSTFKGIWEPAGEKKMAGVLEILDGFPQSKFLLFGDSAEQDLDLYSTLAMQRPHQVLGIFIRDVSALYPTRSSTTASTSTSNSSLSSRSSPPPSPPLFPSEGPGRVHRLASSIRPNFTRSNTSSSTLTTNNNNNPSGTSTPSSSKPTRSRKSSISSLLHLRGEGDQSTDALSPNNPLPDLAMANSMLASSSSTSSSLSQPQPSSNTNPPLIASDPPTISEDVLDPLSTAPSSPKLTAQVVEHPEEAAEEAMTSARIKALKAAEAFRGRFEKAKRELELKGVVVEKFREVGEVEERVRRLVFEGRDSRQEGK